MHLYTLLPLFALLARPARALWPAPRHQETGHVIVRISKSFDIRLGGLESPELLPELGDVSISFAEICQ